MRGVKAPGVGSTSSGSSGGWSADAAEADQSIANNTTTRVSWDTVLVGGLSGFDLSTDATLWTAPTASTYEIVGSVDWKDASAAFAGRRAVILYSNGVKIRQMETEVSPTTTKGGLAFAWSGDLAAGDEITVDLFQNGGAAYTASVSMRVARIETVSASTIDGGFLAASPDPSVVDGGSL